VSRSLVTGRRTAWLRYDKPVGGISGHDGSRVISAQSHGRPRLTLSSLPPDRRTRQISVEPFNSKLLFSTGPYPMPYEDKMIMCAACGQEFVHSAADQERYAQIGLTNEPKRCPGCRAARRTRKSDEAGGGGMQGQSRPPRSFSGGSGPRGGGGDRGRGGMGGRFGSRSGGPPRGRSSGPGSGPRELFDAVCSACGQTTQVPFKPVEGRPVYCRDCYRSRRPM